MVSIIMSIFVSVYMCVCDMRKVLLLLYTGGKAYNNARFGAGSGPIFLSGVQCTSTSSQLLECSSRPILSQYCLHPDDAGVGCEGRLDNSSVNHASSVFSI